MLEQARLRYLDAYFSSTMQALQHECQQMAYGATCAAQATATGNTEALLVSACVCVSVCVCIGMQYLRAPSACRNASQNSTLKCSIADAHCHLTCYA